MKFRIEMTVPLQVDSPSSAHFDLPFIVHANFKKEKADCVISLDSPIRLKASSEQFELTGSGLLARFEPPQLAQSEVTIHLTNLPDDLDAWTFDPQSQEHVITQTVRWEHGKPIIRRQRIDKPIGKMLQDQQVSSQLAWLWAYQQVLAISDTNKDKAIKLASDYHLVTKHTGAVVLETKEQFKEAKLTPIDRENEVALESMSARSVEGRSGSGPEPEMWLLLLIVLFIIVIESVRHRRKICPH